VEEGEEGTGLRLRLSANAHSHSDTLVGALLRTM